MATPDWEAIESAYRAGVLSLRDIGDKYGVTEGAIRKRAKKFDWVRKAVRRYAKMVRKVVRKKSKRVPAKSLPALAVRKKVRNQKPNLHQIRNRYAGAYRSSD
jgi:replicative superfamily II helicase